MILGEGIAAYTSAQHFAENVPVAVPATGIATKLPNWIVFIWLKINRLMRDCM
jgi:hypothetical protein